MKPLKRGIIYQPASKESQKRKRAKSQKEKKAI